MNLRPFRHIERRNSKVINVGEVKVGGDNPISVQSMTNTLTTNIKETIKQINDIAEEGADIVRVSCPDKESSAALKEIVKHVSIPVVADIHFHYKRAIEAAENGAKCLRINPGNIGEESKIHEVLSAAKNNDCSIRIGVNAGSLEKDILEKFKEPCPEALVESALRNIKILEDKDFFNFKISVKSSDVFLSIAAYRKLSKICDYPLHLGITEAGSFVSGSIKSSIGLGSLLMDGIGDTIRVSLTEAPEKEIPIAKLIRDYVDANKDYKTIADVKKNPINPYEYNKRDTHSILNIGSKCSPIVMIDFSLISEITKDTLQSIGYRYSSILDKWTISDLACDYLFAGNNEINFKIPGTLGVVYSYKKWKSHRKGYPLLSAKDYLYNDDISKKLNIIQISLKDLSKELINKLKDDFTATLLIDTSDFNSVPKHRKIAIELMNNGIDSPLIISRSYKNFSREKLQISSSIDFGSLLLDGIGDGIFLSAENSTNSNNLNKLAFDILQATRTRISKTEYISCPSCGRTLFNLEETTAKIRAATSHLKGLKIGIMGCIVNGPGEMADADYGYVGTGVGKISLYKKHTIIKKDVPMNQADEALIDLIKENGDWINP